METNLPTPMTARVELLIYQRVCEINENYRWNLWTHLYLVRFCVSCHYFLWIVLNRKTKHSMNVMPGRRRFIRTRTGKKTWGKGVLALGRASLALKAPSELEMKTEWLVLSRIFQDCIRNIHTAGTFLLGITGFLHVGSSSVTLIFHVDAVWTWNDWVMDGTLW